MPRAATAMSAPRSDSAKRKLLPRQGVRDPEGSDDRACTEDVGEAGLFDPVDLLPRRASRADLATDRDPMSQPPAPAGASSHRSTNVPDAGAAR